MTSLRRAVLAFQFLTRLPTPRIDDFAEDDLTRSAPYFPLVGGVIGAAIAAPLWLLGQRPWLAALAALIIWVWITGALHLDGLGDVADGFGAAHRSPERFLEVLHDPHLGVFGVVAIVLQLITKLVLLAELAQGDFVWALVIIPAWTRWATLVWSRTVPPLHTGIGMATGMGMVERFSWQIPWIAIIVWMFILGGLSLWLAPMLLLAVGFAAAISLYWRWRLGGITGDCLGASTEVTESLLLIAVISSAMVV